VIDEISILVRYDRVALVLFDDVYFQVSILLSLAFSDLILQNPLEFQGWTFTKLDTLFLS
jgi:hypothetical protein